MTEPQRDPRESFFKKFPLASLPQACRRSLHPLHHADVEGTAGLAFAAGEAGGGLDLQGVIMRADGGGDLALVGGGQVVELIHHSDVDIHGAGLTMAAVGTRAVVGLARGEGQHRGVILFAPS